MRTFGKGDDFDRWDFNPYYHPENCDVELLITIDEPNMSYEFNTTIIVKDNPTGVLYVTSDSGCSCPTPFEDVRGLGDMTVLRNMDDFDTYFADNHGYNASDILSARRKIAELLRPTSYFI